METSSNLITVNLHIYGLTQKSGEIKMKHKTTLCILTFTVAAICFSPSQTQAGDQEWATAGKILTGLFAFNVLNDAVHHSRDHSVTEVVYHRPKYRQCKPRKRHYKHTYRKKKIRSRDYNRTNSRHSSRVIRTYEKDCDDPVTVYIENDRRIYQPRIKGAIAYLQVYNGECDQWVTIEEYPSIW